MENRAPEALLKPIIDAARANQRINDGDYRNENGLLVCGVCGKAKETVISINNLVVPCTCDCDIKRMEAEAAQLKKEEEFERIKSLRSISLMDAIFQDATFDKFEVNSDNRENYRLCKHYAEDFDDMLKKCQGLLLFGGPGTGKSFSAACIANYLLNRGIPVIMTSVLRLTEMMQPTENKENDIINRLRSAKLVIFDDLGTERKTDYIVERTYSIIDGRHRSRLPMIVTTNIPLSKMMNETDIRYKRIYERIFETCHPMSFEGKNWRRSEAYKRFEEMDNGGNKRR